MAGARSTLEERPEAVRVAVQIQTAYAELSLCVAIAEARISALESERESTQAAAEAAEEDVNVEVQQLEHQEAAANEIESHKDAHSAAFQAIVETEVSLTGQQLQLSKTRVRQSMAFRCT